jgi:uncharacterized membrane protein HdeD (DUF308 family)
MLGLLIQNWWVLALRGAIAVLFGVLALLWPGITIEVLILLFGIYAIADGIFAIVSGVRAAQRDERWGALVLEGIAGIIAGIIALFVPLAAALAFVYLFAAWALVTGILEIYAAIRLRHEIEGEWLLALTGILSAALGIFIAIFPGAGLIALVWMIGIYAIIVGALMLVLAFRLRSLRPPQASPAHS